MRSTKILKKTSKQVRNSQPKKSIPKWKSIQLESTPSSGRTPMDWCHPCSISLRKTISCWCSNATKSATTLWSPATSPLSARTGALPANFGRDSRRNWRRMGSALQLQRGRKWETGSPKAQKSRTTIQRRSLSTGRKQATPGTRVWSTRRRKRSMAGGSKSQRILACASAITKMATLKVTTSNSTEMALCVSPRVQDGRRWAKSLLDLWRRNEADISV